MKLYMGVDPGLSGAIAVYNPQGWPDTRPAIEVWDVPTVRVKRNRSMRGAVDITALASLIDDIAKRGIKLCTMEWPNAMPRQGTASSHTFGLVTGQLHGVISAHFIPVTRIQPFAWKRIHGLGANKDDARKLATKLFPASAHLWARKKDDGRAEAAILARHGYITENLMKR